MFISQYQLTHKALVIFLFFFLEIVDKEKKVVRQFSSHYMKLPKTYNIKMFVEQGSQSTYAQMKMRTQGLLAKDNSNT